MEKTAVRIACEGADLVEIDDLVDFQGKLKTLSETAYRQLRRSILDLGFSFPVFAWRDEGKKFILDAHQRVRVLRKMRDEGFEIPPLPVVWIQASGRSEAAKKLLAAVAQYGVVTDDGLAGFIRDFDLDFEALANDLRLPEIDFDDLRDEFFPETKEVSFTAKVGPGGGEEDAIADVDLQKTIVSKPGEIYQLGRHRLMCGDSRAKTDVGLLMNGAEADLISTDPPYGMKLETDRRGMGATNTKYRPVIGDAEAFDPQHIFDLFPETPKILWGADYYCRQIVRWSEGSPIVWAKAHSESENAVFGSSFETAWVWPKRKRQLWFIRRINMTDERTGEHPTQKPIEISTRAFETFNLKDGDLVVDLYGGSGSTIIACEKMNLTCHMMEIDPAYCDVICERWEKYTGQQRELLTGEKIKIRKRASM